MIEIAFDENSGSTYNGKKYPVVDVPFLESSFSAYQDFASKIILKHKKENFLIMKADESKFSCLKLAFALFCASCLYETYLDCVVFKVQNQKAAFEAYKPYIAASIGIRYALRLSTLEPFTVYKELQCLNYLNFSLKENYVDKSLIFTMTAPEAQNLTIETKNIFDALVNVSVLKALSLADIKKNIQLKVYITKAQEDISKKALIDAIIGQLEDILSLI